MGKAFYRCLCSRNHKPFLEVLYLVIQRYIQTRTQGRGVFKLPIEPKAQRLSLEQEHKKQVPVQAPVSASYVETLQLTCFPHFYGEAPKFSLLLLIKHLANKVPDH